MRWAASAFPPAQPDHACCIASVWKYCNVLNLSPLGLLETLKTRRNFYSRHAL